MCSAGMKIARTHLKNSGLMVCTSNPTVSIAETGRSLVFDGQPTYPNLWAPLLMRDSLMSVLKSMWRPSNILSIDSWPPARCTLKFMCIYTHMHTHSHTSHTCTHTDTRKHTYTHMYWPLIHSLINESIHSFINASNIRWILISVYPIHKHFNIYEKCWFYIYLFGIKLLLQNLHKLWPEVCIPYISLF
jgi:hypothetical protein